MEKRDGVRPSLFILFVRRDRIERWTDTVGVLAHHILLPVDGHDAEDLLRRTVRRHEHRHRYTTYFRKSGQFIGGCGGVGGTRPTDRTNHFHAGTDTRCRLRQGGCGGDSQNGERKQANGERTLHFRLRI